MEKETNLGNLIKTEFKVKPYEDGCVIDSKKVIPHTAYSDLISLQIREYISFNSGSFFNDKKEFKVTIKIEKL